MCNDHVAKMSHNSEEFWGIICKTKINAIPYVCVHRVHTVKMTIVFQNVFWASQVGVMLLQQCQSGDSPIEPCTALKIGGGRVAQRWRLVMLTSGCRRS